MKGSLYSSGFRKHWGYYMKEHKATLQTGHKTTKWTDLLIEPEEMSPNWQTCEREWRKKKMQVRGHRFCSCRICFIARVVVKKKRRKKRVLQSLTVPSLVNIPWRDYDKQSSVLKCAFECLSRLNIPENCVNTVWEGAVAVMWELHNDQVGMTHTKKNKKKQSHT